MINYISIKDFAIIENTEINFDDGLNIITGETGAGKSIVIEAISLALGSRADTSSIRTGKTKAIVQLQGELDGKEIVITREVSSSGKNFCKLNGEIVTLAELNQVSSRLADIHGQYDNQSLLNPEYHIDLLDSYKKTEISPFKAQVSALYSQYLDVKQRLSSLIKLESENLRKKDFFQYEISEIDNANLTLDEDKTLQEKISILENSEKIFDNVEKSYLALNGEEQSVIASIGIIKHSLDEVSSFSADLKGISSDFNDIYYKIQELSNALRDIKDDITFSPNELDTAISRLDLIENLKKKYGKSISEILAYRDDISNQLNIIQNFDEEKSKLETELKEIKSKLVLECDKLTSIRKKVALELSDKIQKELNDLNFNDSKIQISVDKLDSPTPNGIDKVEILISTNKGEPLKPLAKIASGGEMSRIMLAFKNIISSYDMIPTLIFDEIDNGISGITASIVAQKLREISTSHQIICITHLPQIAASGDTNYRIHKETDINNTFTSVDKLDDEQKIGEIARLLGGTNITETTLMSAKELIANSTK